MDDFFAELEADIAKHLSADKLKKDRDAARKKANTHTLPAHVRQAAGLEYKRIDQVLAAAEWQSVATVALFSEQACDGCGSTHRVFLQYMETQQLIRRPSTQRWNRVAKPTEGLPRETLIQPMTTHICAHCCEDHGFALLTADRLNRTDAVIAPSTTYTQEDINAEAA